MRFDALIIGGGPGGAMVALLLARAGWSVAVVEKSRFPRPKVCGEFLSPTNQALLQAIGIADIFSKSAGPLVSTVNLYAGETILAAPMPRISGDGDICGRALGRHELDTVLLEQAAGAGAVIFQPWSVVKLTRSGEGFECQLDSKEEPLGKEIRAGLVIAAHGSWETGRLPTQSARIPFRAGDLFGFKGRFINSRLPAGAMPLLVFPGGYGGMVHTDGGRNSWSCCIRRDRLEKLRKANPSISAGAAVLAHVKRSCRGVREALADAALDGAILSAGPIRPGIRKAYHEGVFCVGNAAGEAHPIVAEGISMAMQGAWLLSETLLTRQKKVFSVPELEQAGREYAALWKTNFVPRIRAAACFAHLAMRPATANLILPLMKLLPQLLTLGAHWSGKANPLVMPAAPTKMSAVISA